MKFNFKKIASVLATTVMLGSTIAFASAAWPAPFVESGANQAAVVIGANSMDLAAATEVGAALDAKITATTGGEVTGEGDKFLLEKSSTKFHVGNGAVDVVSATVDDDELPNLLADKVFKDNDNDEFDYTQKITLANFSVTMFEDNDYKEDEPTIAVRIASGNPVLNYTIEMADQPLWDDLETADITMLGKEYYILDNTNTSTAFITLLDSAETFTMSEGETKTVTVNGKSYDITVDFVSSTPAAKLVVNGKGTNSLAVGATENLGDGSYIGIKDVSYSAKESTANKVEFGIGNGKLKITQGSDVEINDDAVPRLKGYITTANTGKLSTIILEWKADGDLFVAPGKEAVLPGFKNVKLTWGGITAPATEKIIAKYGSDSYAVLEDFPLKDSTEDLYLVYTTDNANYSGVGKDATNLLVTSGTNWLTYDSDTDDYFIVSWKDSGNKDVESYMMRATGFKREDGINKTSFEYRKNGVWTEFKSDRKPGDTISIGNVELTLNDTSYDAKNATLTYSGSQHSFNTLYSKEGLRVILPWQNSSVQYALDHTPTCAEVTYKAGQIGPVNYSNTTGISTGAVCYSTTFKLQMSEEDKDDTIAAGSQFNVTFGFNSASTPQVSVTAVQGGSGTDTEVGSTDVYRNVIYSALATEYMWDKGGDQDWVTITYNGGETMAKIYLAAPSVSAGGLDTVKVVKDSEADSVKAKNLIVVGGSCINTVAAKMLGSSTPVCGADFTAKAKVAAGQWLVKVAASPLQADKLAMLVAGYEQADTLAGAKAVAKDGASTEVGEKVYPVTK